ncbi:hypothetical protein RB628_42420, partial [Streptomyces sp. ADMS]|nr:hypothetical protein [Streptomyces sp. ADMS]
ALLDPATQTPGHWTKATRQSPPVESPGPTSVVHPPDPADPAAAQREGSDGTDSLLSARTLMAGPSGAGQGRN